MPSLMMEKITALPLVARYQVIDIHTLSYKSSKSDVNTSHFFYFLRILQTLHSKPNSLENVTGQFTTSSTSPMGNYEELTLALPGGNLSVQYYSNLDAFIFLRRPSPTGFFFIAVNIANIAQGKSA